MAQYRLFVGCSFSEDRKNLRDYIADLIERSGHFSAHFGDRPDPQSGPSEKVRSLIKSCHAALIVMTAEKQGLGTAWIYSEFGMAYQDDIPILLLVDRQIKDTGMAKFGVCYEPFDPSNLVASKDRIVAGLNDLERRLENLKSTARTLSNQVRNDLWQMLPEMLADLTAGTAIDAQIMTDLRDNLSRVVVEAFESRDVFSDSDQFPQKLASGRAAKRAIADYIYDQFLRSMADTPDEIVLDSGTVTYTICEKLVEEACQVKIVTNNLAAARFLSQIPNYPCFVLPGKLESRYWASLGRETEKYLAQRIARKPIKYGIIAATSFSSTTGIAGNDARHASFKTLMLEQCPTVIIAFEGEKILRSEGSPILLRSARSEDEDATRDWRQLMKDRDIRVVTNYPEDWAHLKTADKTLFNKTIDDLIKALGPDKVKVLECPQPRSEPRS